MALLTEGDTLVVTKLDRLARNTKEGIDVVEALFERGVRVLKQGIHVTISNIRECIIPL